MLGLDVIEHFSKHDRGGGPCVRKNLKDFLYNRVNFFSPLSEVFITFFVEDNSTLGARSKYLSLKRNIYTVCKGGASEYLAGRPLFFIFYFFYRPVFFLFVFVFLQAQKFERSAEPELPSCFSFNSGTASSCLLFVLIAGSVKWKAGLV